MCKHDTLQVTVSGRHSQGPPFPASIVIFIMLMLLRTKEVFINKKLGWWNNN